MTAIEACDALGSVVFFNGENRRLGKGEYWLWRFYKEKRMDGEWCYGVVLQDLRTHTPIQAYCSEISLIKESRDGQTES